MAEHKNQLRVHIIPIGNASAERVMEPLKTLRPEKIYLYTASFEDAFLKDYNEIKSRLKSELNLSEKDIIEGKINYYDLVECMTEIAKIYHIENSMGNNVYINISGGTMLSVAGSLSRLFFGIMPYFTKVDYINHKFSKDPFIPNIPNLSLDILSKNHVLFLTAIKRFMDENTEISISKKDCIDIINDLNLFHESWEKKSNFYNKLNTHFLDELERKTIIKVEKKPRGKIFLTEEASFVISVFGAYYGISTN